MRSLVEANGDAARAGTRKVMVILPFRGEVRYSLRRTYHGFRNVGRTKGVMMFTTNGGLDEYFAGISYLELPKDMERLQENSRFYRYEYLSPKS